MNIDRILILGTEEVVRQQLAKPLQSLRAETAWTGTLAEAQPLLASGTWEVLITEAALPDATFVDLVGALQGRPTPPVIIVTAAAASVEAAVECLRLGAFGFLLRPFSPAQAEAILRKAGEHLQLLRLNRSLGHLSSSESSATMLGDSPAIEQLRQAVRKVARTDASVLILGESGSGKALVARQLCEQSLRQHAPLVRIDCTRFSESQLEVDLFGSEKAGAPFSGRRQGLLELAEGGTVLLDEIGEIGPAVQNRLLRLLQEQVLERVGGSSPIQVDVRLLATTNRDLEDKVQRQAFREDLFLRLNIVPINVPPLRERKGDLLVLAEHFRQVYARKHGSRVLAISPACLSALQQQGWPGNVRELQHTIERAVIAARAAEILEPFHLDFVTGSAPALGAAAPSPLLGSERDDLDEIEKRHIFAVLEKCHGNRTHAARRLGISIRTLRNKLKEYRADTGDSVDDLPAAAG
jgi:two-component system, NtrC family, response regulator AtoC